MPIRVSKRNERRTDTSKETREHEATNEDEISREKGKIGKTL